MSKKTDKPEKKTEETQAAPDAAVNEETAAEQTAQPSEEALIKEQLEQLQTLSEDFKRKWYLVSAEYDNYRKRTTFQSAQRYQEGRADVVSKLFPIADNLERALAVCNDEATRKGILMVKASFDKILEEEKIETIDPLGQPFDAEKHEAIMAVDPEEGDESGTVKQVYLKGYSQNGKVLRFAQVVVVK